MGEIKSKENDKEIRISKLPSLDEPKQIRISKLPSLDIPDEEDLETKLQNQTSLENPNYQIDPKVEQIDPIIIEDEDHESGFLSVELNPLDSKFRSSIKMLVTDN